MIFFKTMTKYKKGEALMKIYGKAMKLYMKERGRWRLHSKLNLSDLPSILLLVFFNATTCFIVIQQRREINIFD